MKTIPATLLVLATTLLAGCSAVAPTTGASGDGATQVPATAIAQTEPDQRRVTVIKVIDPTTLVVTPLDPDDSLYKKRFTAHLNNFLTPTKGECGYDEALTFTKNTLVNTVWILDYSSVKDGVWIDVKGEHHGFLNTIAVATYGDRVLSAGFAYVAPDGANYMLDDQKKARDAQVGLWATCPGFGA
jgi:uncharacterized protein YceK